MMRWFNSSGCWAFFWEARFLLLASRCEHSGEGWVELENWSDIATTVTQGSGDAYVSEFRVPKMDCPSEEGLIRMALEGIEPSIGLEVDLPKRTVRVFHRGNIDDIEARLADLALGATLVGSTSVSADEYSRVVTNTELTDDREATILKWLLTINAIMFAVEMAVGWLAQSSGLIADSLAYTNR